MIGSIRGKITLKTEKFLVVETGGVGYKIFVSPDTLSKIKQGGETSLFVHTSVREDALDLFGFLSRTEQEFFEMLLSVSGIGPRSALAILGIASIETLRRAISTGDVSYLTKVSGIGKKTAEKIVVELRDKIAELTDSEKGGGSLSSDVDALEALKALGYSQNEARDALKKADGENTNSKIKSALKILGGK